MTSPASRYRQNQNVFRVPQLFPELKAQSGSSTPLSNTLILSGTGSLLSGHPAILSLIELLAAAAAREVIAAEVAAAERKPQLIHSPTPEGRT